MRSGRDNLRGQALVMVTLALIAMCGLMGLAVDLGWSFFVRKEARAAADAAAQAAVIDALSKLSGINGPYSCGQKGVACAPTPIPCGSATSNLQVGCQYAGQNGFTDGGANNRQTVTIWANMNPPSFPPQPASNVTDVFYWVKVRITQTVPQLFSAVLGNAEGTVSAEATAAIARAIVPGSLILINREGDCVNMATGQGGKNPVCGVNLTASGNGTTNVPGGIFMASDCQGPNQPSGCTDKAGVLQGANSTVTSPSTSIRNGGKAENAPQWSQQYTNAIPEGKDFQDPTSGTPQPPVLGGGTNSDQALKGCQVPNGILTGGTAKDPVVLGPYNYFAVTTDKNGVKTASGAPISISGDVVFSTAGGGCSCPGCVPVGNSNPDPPGTFGTYIFWGGVVIGGNRTNLTFSPGQYVMAGISTAFNNLNAGQMFNVNNAGDLTLQSSGSGSGYAGEMFIFTAPGGDGTYPGYPGLATQLGVVTANGDTLGNVANLVQGQSGFQTGNSKGISITLDGINPEAGGVPTVLSDNYGGVALWQDRRNSVVPYNTDGTIACGNTASNCTKPAQEQAADRNSLDSPALNLQASPSIHINGVIYQPRGSWTFLLGSGTYSGPLQLVSGGVSIQGGGSLLLTGPNIPLTKFVAALIQ